MRGYFPAIAALIDWCRPAEWLDKELSQIIGKAGARNQHVDALAKVWLTTGEERTILIHIEIQTGRESEFAFRLSHYNCGLKFAHRQDVITLVVLADLNAGWKPESYTFEMGGFRSRIDFPVCKIVERLDADWRDVHSLPVEIARAQVEALRTSGDPEGRFRAKLRLVRGLYERGFTAAEVREAFRLIDWMMHLRPDLGCEFDRQLVEFEKEKAMPYVTSFERNAVARGEIQGKAAVLADLLGRIIGGIPAETDRRVRQLPAPALEKLQEVILDLGSLDELHGWLDQHGE